MKVTKEGVLMDLLDSAWMQRNLGESVSCVHLLPNGDVLAGGWDGNVTFWDQEGHHYWTTNTSNRISAVLDVDDTFIVTSGLDVVCISKSDGQHLWSIALEGSADQLLAFGQGILATSSTYDIEHNDFIESVVWLIDKSGTLLWTHRMNERPWFGYVDGNNAHFGLGRPRCGLLHISESGEAHHSSLPEQSPVMCGCRNQDPPVFGLANGNLVSASAVVFTSTEGIEFLCSSKEGYVLGLEDGNNVSIDKVGKQNWNHKGAPLSALTISSGKSDEEWVWVARKRGERGTLQLIQASTGTLLADQDTSRIHSLASTDQRVCAGFEDGSVVVWDREMVQRRLSNDNTPASIDPNREAMLAKLRALRR